MTVSDLTWKAGLHRRLWLGRGDPEEWTRGWMHVPRAIEVEWVKLRERNEALDCAVPARAAL